MCILFSLFHIMNTLLGVFSLSLFLFVFSLVLYWDDWFDDWDDLILWLILGLDMKTEKKERVVFLVNLLCRDEETVLYFFPTIKYSCTYSSHSCIALHKPMLLVLFTHCNLISPTWDNGEIWRFILIFSYPSYIVNLLFLNLLSCLFNIPVPNFNFFGKFSLNDFKDIFI